MDSPCFQRAVQPSPWAIPRGDERGGGYGHARTKLRRLQKRPRRTRAARPGCIFSLFWSCFALLSRRGKPPRRTPGCARFLRSSRGLRANHRRRVVPGVLFLSCYLQGFTGKQACTGLYPWAETPKPGSACADGRRRPLRKGRKPRAIPGRAGTGRPRRRSRRVRSRRSPPPCGRRARARGRRAPPADYWALPSPRRCEARARWPIHRAAG